jgi:hypothetical protein
MTDLGTGQLDPEAASPTYIYDTIGEFGLVWWRGLDLNQRPSGYEPSANRLGRDPE